MQLYSICPDISVMKCMKCFSRVSGQRGHTSCLISISELNGNYSCQWSETVVRASAFFNTIDSISKTISNIIFQYLLLKIFPVIKISLIISVLLFLSSRKFQTDTNCSKAFLHKHILYCNVWSVCYLQPAWLLR